MLPATARGGTSAIPFTVTVWHEIFAGVCGSPIFCILRELFFAIVKDWFFLLGINFCDFQEAAFNWNTVFWLF